MKKGMDKKMGKGMPPKGMPPKNMHMENMGKKKPVCD